ncbi:MAG: hypothetical protein ACOX4U_01615 [Anaerovoracaceae bacterium]|jgi:signal transduction histidine kinase
MDKESLEYYNRKKRLLEQCLHCSEELMSSLSRWEEMPDVMKKKEQVLLELKELEESTELSAKTSLSLEQKGELNDKIKLIVALDGDTSRRIKEEQEKIKESLKATVNGQKVIEYGSQPHIGRGRKIDYKK